MELTKADILNLILIGRTDKTANNDLFLYFKQRDYINRQHGDTWRKLVADILDNDLVELFKGLVKLERELQWIGGSVAGAIWVYNIIQQRRLDNDYTIADFGLRNCDNPWVPFGDSYYGVRTIAEYFAYSDEKSRVSAIKSDRYDKVLTRVEGRKERRVAAIAELRQLSKEQRGQILSELSEKYSSATTKEKLELIAVDKKFPPEYYPVEWIDIKPEDIEKLPANLIKRLYDKLSTKTKGQWKRFAQELEKFDDGI